MRLASFARRSLAAVAIATPVAIPAAAQQPTPPPTVTLAPEAPAIVTTGTGEARTVPDRAIVQIGVQTRAATASAAATANATRQRAIIDTLVALGIPRAQITTTQYNVFPESQHDPRENRERVIGYIVSNVVRIELRRTDLVGPAIDAALAKGANQVNSLNFYAENTDEPRRQALAQAVARARADADALAAPPRPPGDDGDGPRRRGDPGRARRGSGARHRVRPLALHPRTLRRACTAGAGETSSTRVDGRDRKEERGRNGRITRATGRSCRSSFFSTSSSRLLSPDWS